MKRALMILVWTSAAYFGCGPILAMIYGLLAGIVIGVSLSLHYDINSYFEAHRSSLAFFVRFYVRILCGLIAGAFFILGLYGRLPGTKVSQISN